MILVVKNTGTVTGSDSHSYRMTKMNSKTGDISRSTITLPENLGEEDYLYFHNDDGDEHHLITNFGVNEYYCTGTCVCMDESERRMQPNPLKRLTVALAVLVGGFTTIIAINEARKRFWHECWDVESDDCSGGFELFPQNTCEKIQERASVWNVPDDEYDPQDAEAKRLENSAKRKYECSGRCRSRKYIMPRNLVQKSAAFGCEKLEVTEEFEIFVSFYQQLVDGFEFIAMTTARRAFINEKLNQFCEGRSRIRSVVKVINEDSGELEEITQAVPLCTGLPLDEMDNDSVECIDIPLPQNQPIVTCEGGDCFPRTEDGQGLWALYDDDELEKEEGGSDDNDNDSDNTEYFNEEEDSVSSINDEEFLE